MERFEPLKKDLPGLFLSKKTLWPFGFDSDSIDFPHIIVFVFLDGKERPGSIRDVFSTTNPVDET